MKVLVTGASGYLGSVLCARLKHFGHEVWGLDSHWNWKITPPNPPGLHTFTSPPWQDVAREVRSVVHLAWYAQAGDGEPRLQRHCVDMTYELLQRVSCVTPLVFTSTANIYGDTGEEVVSEDRAPNPGCAYTRAKLDGEILCLSHNDAPLILRLGSLMGVGQKHGGCRTKLDVCVNAFAHAAHQEKPVQVWHPDAWKPILHVVDAARVIHEGIERCWSGVYNCASLSLRAREIAQSTITEYGSGVKLEIIEPPAERLSQGASTQRSVRLWTRKLGRYLPHGFFFHTLTEAIEEFRGYQPGPGDVQDRSRWKDVDELLPQAYHPDAPGSTLGHFDLGGEAG